MKENKNPWQSVSIFLGVLLLCSLATNAYIVSKIDSLSAGSPSGDTAIVPDNGNNGAAAPGTVVAVSTDDDAVLGSKDAPVTIIEFSDYQCPFCERFYTDSFSQIKKNYIDTGKVKFVYRDFPLSFHPFAQKAAEAAECAGDQNKYYEYGSKLFENQAALDVPSLKQYAKDLGLNSATFDSCLDSGKQTAETQKDFQDGQAAGVSGTPSFFINGKQIVGAQPYAVFQQAIDAELAK